MSGTLLQRLESTGKLPTPPGVVLQLLDLTRREDVSARDIADTLALDPALAAKVLRFANSPMAGMPREVTSIPRAVALAGVRGVKMMALSFAVLGTNGTEACPGFDQEQFGVQAIGCGVAAGILATEIKTGSSQEAFLAGLLSQIGRAVLASGMPDEYAKVLAEARQIPADLPLLEQRAFGETYPVIGAQLLRSWGIPEALCAAIEKLHPLEGDEQVPALAKVLHVAEIASAIICPDTKGDPPDPRAFIDAAFELLGIADERCADLINQIAAEVENTRVALDMPKGKMRSPEDLQIDVRERIAELSLAMHMENQVMAQQQEDLLRRATTDALTGIGNRAAFDARLTLELQRSGRSGAPFALLMMDVDKFKAFNDTYGHQAGDRVLQTVARVIDSNIRKVDYAARYGGEEFAVIAPEASAEGAGILAERLRQAVAETAVPWEGQKLGVTISVGVAVSTDIVDDSDAALVVKEADAQLYAAKCAGRNRVEMVVNGASVALAHS